MQPVVDHRKWVVAHLAGTRGVEDGRAHVAGIAEELVIRLQIGAREFLRHEILFQRRCVEPIPHHAQAGHDGSPVAFLGHVIGIDCRLLVRVG